LKEVQTAIKNAFYKNRPTNFFQKRIHHNSGTQKMIAIGYDIGSSFVKAALVDVTTGKPINRVRVPETEIPMEALQLGWAEQDPNLWWHYLCDATKMLLKEA
jgi:sugar (pentulose or hexulose) kinase